MPDQIARMYLVKAGTRRWPVAVFYNILDLAGRQSMRSRYTIKRETKYEGENPFSNWQLNSHKIRLPSRTKS